MGRGSKLLKILSKWLVQYTTPLVAIVKSMKTQKGHRWQDFEVYPIKRLSCKEYSTQVYMVYSSVEVFIPTQFKNNFQSGYFWSSSTIRTISKKMELREKLSNFDHYNESHFQCDTQSLKIFPEASLLWKLLIFGIVSAKGIRKKLPVLQVGGPAPACPSCTSWI